jgi:magnesium chelatase family protein
MSVARILSRTQLGLDVPLVQVELHLGRGLPGFTIVGLPAPVVRESRERVRAALLNSGYEFPAGRITVNLAPVELSKQGGRFDLPIALGLLIASGQLCAPRSAFECYGELGLAGELRPVSGLFLAALHAQADGHELIVPAANGNEVALSGHGAAYGAASLREAASWLAQAHSSAQGKLLGASGVQQQPAALPAAAALADVAGQWQAKRALIIAAAGRHSLLMVGPPGSGKSMLAAPAGAAAGVVARRGARGCRHRIDLRWPARCRLLDAAAVLHFASHRFGACHRWRGVRRCVRGRSAWRTTGCCSWMSWRSSTAGCSSHCANHSRPARSPLRAGSRLALPAQFQLVAAMNPCACGYLGDTMHACRCTPAGIERYRQRISGPLLDRIDIRISVPRLAAEELLIGAVQRGAGEPNTDPAAQAGGAWPPAARVRCAECATGRCAAAPLLCVAAGIRTAATAQLPTTRAVRTRGTPAAGARGHDC